MTSSPNDQMIHLRAIRSERCAASDRNTCARWSESADNRPPLEGGDELMIQGATVRLKAQPDTAASEAAQTQPEPQQPATQDETNPVEDNENAE